MTSGEIRQQFLDFFKSKGHEIVPSAPIVVKNDPTLLFTNAGMNQFKDYFLGNKKPASTRVADTQKCLRVSGKHNDLEEVGVDTYHHTMFEMLGNWSFGDYFKAEAIAWSWELLTEVFKLDKDRLYVTIFEGDANENLAKDEEAYNEWKKWISEDRILLGNKKDNFWEMGDTGPCGPCSEIHVDCRSDEERKQVEGKTLVNADHPQVIEIWNNVFMQFNRLKDGSLEPLPAKHVDTGMGFERLVRVIQGKQSNYDTDVFTGTIAETEKITGKKYDYSDSKEAVAFRVLADHIRAIAFTIADGQLPANNGAGYVIKRILRRAVRYYYTYLDYKQPLLYELLPLIAKQFETVFPELFRQQNFVLKIIKEEELSFLKTLGAGIKRLEKAISIEESLRNLPPKDSCMISGQLAFELLDTYGFPIDLTRLMLKEEGYFIDEKEFQIELDKQKDRSREVNEIIYNDWVIVNNDFINPWSDSGSIYVGDEYDKEQKLSEYIYEKICKIKKFRSVKKKGELQWHIVLDRTPFYAESGGQVGDTGILVVDNTEIKIIDTKKENDLIIHITKDFITNPDAKVLAVVDKSRKKDIARNHSSTHLLHAALRKVLGLHVEQKGSLVNEEYLRFDFSHFAKVTDKEIKQIESIVNEKIRENILVEIKKMSKTSAIELGAMALFGEKYGEEVRVVIIDPEYSIELCGGTHVRATGQLGFFKIQSESAVAAGVRRIEAVSGKAAEDVIKEQGALLRGIKEALKNPKDLQKAVESLQAENSELKKTIEHLENRFLVGIRNELLHKDEIINGVTFVGSMVEVSNADALKKLCFELKSHLNDHLAVLCANIGGKPFVAVSIDEKVVAAKNLDAGKIIKEHIAPLIKGGGGGQKTLATAGGQDASNLQAVIEKVKSLL